MMNLFNSWSVEVNCSLMNNVFYPGNIVEGVVTISTNSPISYNSIRLKFCGKERVHCQRDEKIPDGPPRPPPNGQGPPVQHYKTIKRSYYSTNVVMKQLITLAGSLKYSGGGFGEQQLPPGRYSYPFAFQLPYDLPPSFNRTISDDTASIMYYAKAYVDVPMGRDAVSKAFFSVVRPMPLSQWRHGGPVGVNRMFDVTCCCCVDKGKVGAFITMDRTCIAIDRDWLQLFSDIDNTKCSEPVENLEISLRHTLTYKAANITEAHSYVAGRKTLGTPIVAGGKGLVNGVIELTRGLMPSFKTPNVSSSYVITIEMSIPWASDPCHSFPVVIGQSVDDSDVSPPIVFDSFTTSRFTPPRQPCQEYFYQVPQRLCYPYAPVPNFQPPQGIAFMPVPSASSPLTFPLPSASWYEGNPPPPPYGRPNSQPIQWQSGYGQVQQPNYIMPPPPTQPATYGGNGMQQPQQQPQPTMALPAQGAYQQQPPQQQQPPYGQQPPQQQQPAYGQQPPQQQQPAYGQQPPQQQPAYGQPQQQQYGGNTYNNQQPQQQQGQYPQQQNGPYGQTYNTQPTTEY